eukprot:Nk52_evm10s296 gene=Nk52_evmTU10s296
MDVLSPSGNGDGPKLSEVEEHEKWLKAVEEDLSEDSHISKESLTLPMEKLTPDVEQESCCLVDITVGFLEQDSVRKFVPVLVNTEQPCTFTLRSRQERQLRCAVLVQDETLVVDEKRWTVSLTREVNDGIDKENQMLGWGPGNKAPVKAWATTVTNGDTAMEKKIGMELLCQWDGTQEEYSLGLDDQSTGDSGTQGGSPIDMEYSFSVRIRLGFENAKGEIEAVFPVLFDVRDPTVIGWHSEYGETTCTKQCYQVTVKNPSNEGEGKLEITEWKQVEWNNSLSNRKGSAVSDEVCVSGRGNVRKEIHEEKYVNEWAEVIASWDSKKSKKVVFDLWKKSRGIPDLLRSSLWQLLVDASSTDLQKKYPFLVSQECSSEKIITWDIKRTFPANDYFKEKNGLGQESLFKISKAYANYDLETGYCQGISFIGGVLLLHMPEEEAFVVLVKIMYDYHMRLLFMQGMEELKMKFYQLECLIDDMLPSLYAHLVQQGIETEMYASQWFLTIFAAKFPLDLVFQLMDVFLCEGEDMIFTIAVSLLKDNQDLLMKLEFEEILKFFRISLPKRYCEDSSQLLELIYSTKINSKKLKRFRKEYAALKAKQMEDEDPLKRLEKANKRLRETNARLESENDNLAQEVVMNKVSSLQQVDKANEEISVLKSELLRSQERHLNEVHEKELHVDSLQAEVAQVKDMYRKAIVDNEEELKQHLKSISDLKDLIKEMAVKSEKEKAELNDEMTRLKALLKSDGKEVEVEEYDRRVSAEKKVKELETELAISKLKLAETETLRQKTSHDLAMLKDQEKKNGEGSKQPWYARMTSKMVGE